MGSQSDESELQALRRRVRELERESVLFRAILDNAPALISSKDLRGVVTSANRRFALLAGPAPEEFVGRSVFELFPREVAEALWRNDQQAAQELRCVEAEERVAHRDGSVHIYQTVKFPLIDGDGQLLGTGAFSIDVTEDKIAIERSITDDLTGLYNRRCLNEWLATADVSWPATQRWRAMAMIDIDHFKDFNDHYGHLHGDRVLAAVAGALRGAMLRPGDRAFRFGGEEFLLVYDCSDAQGVSRVAERICEVVRALRLPHGFNPPHGCVTVSLGVCSQAPGAAGNCRQLLEGADRALYRAKEDGRNRVHLEHLG